MSSQLHLPLNEQAHSRANLWRELWHLLKLASPIVLSELGWMTMGVVDLIMVGKLGPAAIGAVGLGNAIYYGPSLFGIGLLLGLDTLIAQAWGRRDFDECHRWLAQGVYLAVTATIPLMLLVMVGTLLFTGHGVNAQVSGLTRSFLLYLNWSTLPLLVYGAFRRYLQSVGSVRPISVALISANLVNWALNWALIYGHLGFPAMGVQGSAISTCFARLYMAAVLIYAAWLHEKGRGHALFAHWPRFDLQRLRSLCALGLPAGTQVVLEVAGFGAATIMASHLDPVSLATHEIVLNCAAYTYMVPLGISAAAAVAVGHAIGGGDRARAGRAGYLAIALGAGFMACMVCTFLLFPQQILSLWTRDAQVIALGEHILLLVAAFQIFDGIQSVTTGALRGMGETRYPMWMNLGAYWIFGLPLGALLCFGLHWQLTGLWIGLTAALILLAIALLLRWRSDLRREAAVPQAA
jgi:MATE family multidrug resistance protein